MGSWNAWHEDEIFGESKSPKKVQLIPVTYLNVLVYII